MISTQNIGKAEFIIHSTHTTSPQIKDALSDLPRIAKLVEKDTGWKLSGRLHICTPDVDALMNKIDSERAATFNIHFKTEDFAKIREIFDKEDLDAVRAQMNLVEAVYMPHLKELCLADHGVNAIGTSDDVKSSLYHELVHYLQDTHHPEFMAAIDQAKVISMRLNLENDKKNAKLIKIMENRVLSLQSMAEGQPTRLQQIHDKDYFPNKVNKDGNYKALKIVTTLLPFGLLKKVNQYIKGVDFFKVHPVSAPAVDQFFNPRFAETAIK
ncbi:MAG: hypothetical protein VX185_04430 [Pseudomonadota bacterium]|nr:hypothetical protein [Pseudomonadota bacterium]